MHCLIQGLPRRAEELGRHVTVISLRRGRTDTGRLIIATAVYTPYFTHQVQIRFPDTILCSIVLSNSPRSITPEVPQ